MSKPSTYSGAFRKKWGNNDANNFETGLEDRDESSERLRQIIENNAIDEKYSFPKVTDHNERIGFLINLHACEVIDEDKRFMSAIDYYFLQEDGHCFKVTYPFKPYFYVLTKNEYIREVSQFLTKKFSGTIHKIELVTKEDLDLPNHLIGLKQNFLKLSFLNQTDMQKVKRDLNIIVRKNKSRLKETSAYTKMVANFLSGGKVDTSGNYIDHTENILDIREHDVPYHVRVSIDLKIFCGSWYSVRCLGSGLHPPIIKPKPELIERPEPVVLAFDIETTKPPLKFPDATFDKIMMISYMIDGRGYLITNREILSSDISNFEYTPKPELKGHFKIFNEPNEESLLKKFFEHILKVKPHIFVTYNGDFFDWPFIEARAAYHNINMKAEIGFSKNKEGLYTSRPAIHMDCLCWVKRDSYLPVGSQNLKAVAKAKLRYDPVELDPEEMCPLAASNPQVLANYSVSDAVATYYLYMKYVHPFIFALCTIIPCEPDEVLRKGSGTLCEALLMVEAFHANIIFPNKHETVLNKMTDDGHVLLQETYVGGHVEALESGIFRADIPCRFRICPEAIDNLIEHVPRALKHAIEVEEGVPLDLVTNFEDVKGEINEKLVALKECPMRLERPLIYHLDVGAMYPNIILTNRLQPSAIVDEAACAACDFNKSNAACKRNMAWMWRAEYMPASRGEYQRIQLQLETEKFPPKFPGGPMRAFHQLSRAEQAELEKSRLSVYCRKVYKKNKVTKLEERTTTICQKENSFYVDTVRAFRDRRYEYKGLSKKAKQEVTNAVKSGDAGEIKSAKNKEILYDSLQLAHKCILNSFYGYVMRAGSRWYSMEMGGIVCHTGANIITKAREIIEKIGRPLELDTDGIWCILPASFPENFTVYTNHEKKKKLNISYPNAVLNAMVKEHFTNDQYHELINPETHEYIQKSENSIFFEVDGPYKAMMLPASKEEGKKLKKRYAVFNFDGSLAELKGFEVKRRGELQLIKNFQSSVFESFLKGDSLESCYAAVAQVADYWLDVLYSKGRYMEDSELFDLISENRSMSKKLEEYGSQKSTSISTAKRLAEFLGDQMVKDAGLACKYVISKKPDGAPVTERAIPLAIFQSEEAVKIHFLRRWLKDNTLVDVDIRDILDWNYYIERLGGAIQKIITIPAAMQGVSNPVPRVSHPLWLHKKVLEKGDKFKQRSITDMFSAAPKDIEDFGFQKPTTSASVRVATVTKRKRANNSEEEFTEDQLSKTWRDVLGNPPPFGKTQDERLIWLNFQKKKWRFQAMQRALGQQMMKRAKGSATVLRSLNQATLGGFLQKSQRSLLANPWQIVQIAGTNTPGEFKLWALVQSELHEVKLTVPRIFYTNLRTPKCADEGALFKKCNRILPRQKPIYNLYQWTVPEELFQERKQSLMDQSEPNTEGIYETQVPLLFRALLTLGCLCKVRKGVDNLESFALEELEIVSMSRQNYLADGAMKHLYLYHHKGKSGPRQMFALFLTPLKKAVVFVVDSVRTNLMPNLQNLYEAERIVRLENNPDDNLPPSDFTFEIRVETDVNQVFKLLQKALHAYRDEKKGPTLLSVQTQLDFSFLQSKIPSFGEMPTVPIHVQDIEELYNNLEWQKIGAKALIRHYLNSEKMLILMLEQCRYFHLPVGNFPADPAVFGADLFYARHLVKHNHVLWCSPLDRPDLGGSQENNARLLAENLEGSSELCNKSGWYSTISVELDVDSLAINTILQVPNIVEAEGTSSTTTFDADVAPTLDDMLRTESAMTNYDETARCAAAFKILRNMAIGWMRDISEHRNVFADFQVIHFYRWLRSPKALLYDPALLKTLQNLMKKLFVMLISRLQELNCNIIYANFDKLVLSSKHTNVKDALDSIEFIVTTIRNKEIFHTLEISYSKCWEQLVWLDSVNYGGIVGKLPEGTESNTLLENVDRPEHPEDDDTPIVMMNWSLAEQLPDIAGCRNSFKAIIAGYVNAIYLKAHQNHNRTQLSLTTKEEQDIAEFAEEILRNDLSQKLFEITEKLYNRLPPKLDGVNVALEFVKIICHILSLYPPVRDTVANIKCSLLKIIGIGEYSDESIFKDNTVSYVISQLICKVCNHCRDVDLGRDPHRSETGWLCPLCNSPYENPDIEWILLDTVNRKIMAFNLQDLQCRLCKEIKFENLMKRCSCGGTFKHLIDRKEFVKLLETFSKIGEKYDMHSLKETVDQILQLT